MSIENFELRCSSIEKYKIGKEYCIECFIHSFYDNYGEMWKLTGCYESLYIPVAELKINVVEVTRITMPVSSKPFSKKFPIDKAL